LLVATVDEAVNFPTGDLRLAYCRFCGFIWNVDFQPELMRYSAAYEETQVFSAHFREFQSALVNRWVDRYGLRNRQVLEIGCGKGDFLLELCERGHNIGLGIDPSYRPDRHEPKALQRAVFATELYNEAHTDQKCDFICCRHTLEHICDVREFMKLVQRHTDGAGHAIVAFELPDVERVLTEQAFWDIYYEHCSYFSLGSLGRLFRSINLEILDLYKEFDEQYLIVEAQPAKATPRPHAAEEALEQLASTVQEFKSSITSRLDHWNRYVREHHAAGRRVAVWGSGSKAVAFLNRLDLRKEVAAVIDINPHKHGKFLAGTGHQIVSPQSLRTDRPDVVIAMNPAYLQEIRNDLLQMDIHASVVAL